MEEKSTLDWKQFEAELEKKIPSGKRFTTMVKVAIEEFLAVFSANIQKNLQYTFSTSSSYDKGISLRLIGSNTFLVEYNFGSPQALTLTFVIDANVRLYIDQILLVLARQKNIFAAEGVTKESFSSSSATKRQKDVENIAEELKRIGLENPTDILLTCMWILGGKKRSLNYVAFPEERIIEVLLKVSPNIFPTSEKVVAVINNAEERKLIVIKKLSRRISLSKSYGIGLTREGHERALEVQKSMD